jgi:hypothetical protein
VFDLSAESLNQVPTHPWPLATNPWQRIHLDFAKKFDQTFLILFDSYSKWIEVFLMKTTTADKTIGVLRTCFASFGLPELIVTDKVSSETLEINLKKNKVRALIHMASRFSGIS